jgi:plastocyanin
MRKLLLTAFALVVLTFAACDSSSSQATSTPDTPVATDTSAPADTATPAATAVPSAATITLGAGVFVSTTATIKAGQAVKFDDSRGGPHHLVTGKNGTLTAENGAPSELTGSGVSFSGGDTQTVTFPTAGTFTITCTFHPAMEATITVKP